MIDEQTEKNVREFFKNLPSEYLEKAIYFKNMDFDTVQFDKILDGVRSLNNHIKELMKDKTRDHDTVYNEITSLQNVFIKIYSNPYVSYALLQDSIDKTKKYAGGNN